MLSFVLYVSGPNKRRQFQKETVPAVQSYQTHGTSPFLPSDYRVSYFLLIFGQSRNLEGREERRGTAEEIWRLVQYKYGRKDRR